MADKDLRKDMPAASETGHTYENRQEIYPKEDFFMCIKYDKFPFVIKINKDEHGFITSREYVL